MITFSQCRAARALVEWSREELAREAAVDLETLTLFERHAHDPGIDVLLRLQKALEAGGAVFIDESSDGGAGVRLKFNRKDVRAIRRWEGEGGPVGEDDV